VRIKNWHRFQHFKNRRPPWIKLYRDLLDDPEWHDINPISAKYLVMLWLIASEDHGNLPCVKKLAFRLRCTEKQIETILSTLGHWLDITMISPRHQGDTPEGEGEREREGYKEEKEKKKTVSFTVPTFEEVKAYIEERNSPIDPVAFHSHYATNGWRVGKGGLPMKDWQAAVVTWERRVK